MEIVEVQSKLSYCGLSLGRARRVTGPDAALASGCMGGFCFQKMPLKVFFGGWRLIFSMVLL